MAEYQISNTRQEESQYEMLKKLELSYDNFLELKEYCDEKNVLFLSTPDEEESATFLSTIQDTFKVGSGELTNTPFLRHIASFGKPIIISTGMGFLFEVEHAINVLQESGLLLKDKTVLHATTDYPTLPKDVNLTAMLTMKAAFPGINIGYSDHTLGIEIPVAAVALGATVIEKHFTLDKTMSGPDHSASLEPEELKEMVRVIRNTEVALGTGWKVPTDTERKSRKLVRKSIVANEAICKGDVLTDKVLGIKRPGDGLPPTRWDEVVGSIATKDYEEGDLI
jgi:N-acetylneuraminate synthase